MAHSIDNYRYPLDPRAGGFSGVRQSVVRADVPTFGGNISLLWPQVWGDTLVREEWAQLEAAQFHVFAEKYLAAGGGQLYTWSPGDGSSYQVEIIGLEGRPFKGETYINVTLTLKVHTRLS